MSRCALFFALALLMPPFPVAAAAAPAIRVGEGGARDDWTWTWMNEQGLGLGGGGLDESGVRYVHDLGFRAILNYREEKPDNETALKALDMEYLFLPTTFAESDTMPLSHIHMAVDFIESNLAAGRPVYVHCIGGWHRSAAGVVAYFMKTNHWRFEEAWAYTASVRPGIESRFMDVLLEYEAELFGEEKLTLDLWAERWDVVPGEVVNVTGLVTRANGTPVEGAHVRFNVEYRSVTEEDVSDADGLVHFPFTAPAGGLMQYVHAVAQKDGFINGYDRNLFWVKTSKTAPPTILNAPSTVEAAPGGPVVFDVSVNAGEKGGTNGRVTVTGPCGTHFRAYTGWDGRMEVAFVAPLADGEYPLALRATRFPAEPVGANVTLVVGNGGAAPPCETWSLRRPPPVRAGDDPPSAQGGPAASGVDGRFSVPSPAVGVTLVVLFAVACGLAPRRSGR